MRTEKFIGSQKFHTGVIVLSLFTAVVYLSSSLIVSGGETLPTMFDLTVGGFFALNALFWWAHGREPREK